MKLIRNENGICICESCSRYSLEHKCCSTGRSKPDSAMECKDYKCAFGIRGANDAKWSE